MNTPKEIAAEALAKAVREIIDYDDGCSYIYGRADYKVPTALRAYEAMPAGPDKQAVSVVKAFYLGRDDAKAQPEAKPTMKNKLAVTIAELYELADKENAVADVCRAQLDRVDLPHSFRATEEKLKRRSRIYAHALRQWAEALHKLAEEE